MTQDKPTDAQLVALAERLGWTVLVEPQGLWLFSETDETVDDHPLSWLRTPDGALGAIQAAMAGLGYTRWSCDFYAQGSPPYTAAFWKSGQDNYKESEASIAPDAIALAACAALGVPTEEVNR